MPTHTGKFSVRIVDVQHVCTFYTTVLLSWSYFYCLFTMLLDRTIRGKNDRETSWKPQISPGYANGWIPVVCH
jgi:hypothetical protein